MTKYRAGDKVLIECTVLVDSDSPVVRVELDSTTGSCLEGEHILTRAIKAHTPKPIELAAGQTWKRVGTDQRVQVMHVDPVNHDSGRRRFVVSRFMTDIPVSNFYDDFLRAHEYVSG